MKIAIPLQNGRVFPECGQPAEFALVEVDETTQTVQRSTACPLPPLSTAGWADWLAEQAVDVVLTRGIPPDQRARLTEKGIRVVAGIPPFRVSAVVAGFLNGTLESGPNICDSAPGMAA
jgi:predicted Fe-Mo cluster-binding NifX family protein